MSDSAVAEAKYSEYTTTEPLFRNLALLPGDVPTRAALREELIRLHLPLADHIARRFARRGELVDDLVQVARLGLLKAVDRFDPERGTAFLAFATPTITGEVRRHFRDSAWYIRVPRRVQEVHLRLGQASEELSARYGRSPTHRMLADHLGVTPELVREGLQATNAYSPAILDAPVADRLGGSDPGVERIDDRAALDHALTTLTERERRIIGLRFVEEWTQAQIAQDLGMSQMQVSRLLAAILKRMRTEILASA